MFREENTHAGTLSKLGTEEPMEDTWIESLQEKIIAKEICVIESVMIGLNQLRIAF